MIRFMSSKVCSLDMTIDAASNPLVGVTVGKGTGYLTIDQFRDLRDMCMHFWDANNLSTQTEEFKNRYKNLGGDDSAAE